jgi:hypothetical protein
MTHAVASIKAPAMSPRLMLRASAVNRFRERSPADGGPLARPTRSPYDAPMMSPTASWCSRLPVGATFTPDLFPMLIASLNVALSPGPRSGASRSPMRAAPASLICHLGIVAGSCHQARSRVPRVRV